jgi:polar amino acid transport system substrate-binding protein
LFVAVAVSALVVSACGSSGNTAATSSSSATSAAGSTNAASGSGSGGASSECSAGALPTLADGTLTIATSEPAFEPWMIDNDPTSGKGFESAVAYAVADQLGYPTDKVTWTRVGFDEAIAKPDGFDFDINQFTITPDRSKVVDFSSGYYTVAQTVITVDGSPISGATTLAALKDAKLGAMNGTTSLQAITATIDPTTAPQVFDDNSLAAQALQNGQVDGLVVDLPTAFYMTGAQLDNGKVIGQLKATSGDAEQLGLLLAKDSALTSCVTAAVDALRADGTLAALETQWLAGTGTAPVLS